MRTPDVPAASGTAFSNRPLRVRPRQIRSIATVERLLAAAELIVLRERNVDKVKMEVIAREAGVTQQSAYRYFIDVRDLMHACACRFRRLQSERLFDFLKQHRIENTDELAHAVVSFIAAGRGGHPAIAGYHDVADAAIWPIAEAIHEAVIHGKEMLADIAVFQIGVGLAAVLAASRALGLRDPALLSRTDVQCMMAGIFSAALCHAPAATMASGAGDLPGGRRAAACC